MNNRFANACTARSASLALAAMGPKKPFADSPSGLISCADGRRSVRSESRGARTPTLIEHQHDYRLMLAQSYPAMNRQASRLRKPEGDACVSSSEKSHPSRTLAEAHSLAVRIARPVDWLPVE